MLIIRLLGGQAVLDGATGRIRTGSSRTLALLGLLIARTGRPQNRATSRGNFGPSRVTAKRSPICAGTARAAAHLGRGRFFGDQSRSALLA